MNIELKDGVPPALTSAAQAPEPLVDRGADPVRIAILLSAAVLMIAVVTFLGPILKPFLIAVFLFFATRALAAKLIRLHIPSRLAYLLLFVSGATVMTVMALLAYSASWALQAEFPRYQQRILDLIDQVPLGAKASHSLAELFTQSSGGVLRYCLSAGVGLLELLILIFFYLLFLLLGSTKLAHRTHRAFPGERGERTIAVAGKIGASIERFLLVKTQVSLGMATAAAVIMASFGLDGWLLWALVFFTFNYITYIGSILACVPPIAVAFVDLQSPWHAAALAGLLLLNRFVWIDFVEIKLSGRHLNIDSVLLFLWLAYWGWVWGVIGLVLGFPMLTSLKIVLEHLEGTKRWAVLMSED